MARMISLIWLRIERMPMAWFEYAPGVLLVMGGLLVLGLGLI